MYLGSDDMPNYLFSVRSWAVSFVKYGDVSGWESRIFVRKKCVPLFHLTLSTNRSVGKNVFRLMHSQLLLYKDGF